MKVSQISAYSCMPKTHCAVKKANDGSEQPLISNPTSNTANVNFKGKVFATLGGILGGVVGGMLAGPIGAGIGAVLCGFGGAVTDESGDIDTNDPNARENRD